MRLAAILLTAAACYSLEQVKSARCDTYCRVKEGADSGFYQNGKCHCVESREYDRAEEKRLVLPRKVKRHDPDPPVWEY